MIYFIHRAKVTVKKLARAELDGIVDGEQLIAAP